MSEADGLYDMDSKTFRNAATRNHTYRDNEGGLLFVWLVGLVLPNGILGYRVFTQSVHENFPLVKGGVCLCPQRLVSNLK